MSDCGSVDFVDGGTFTHVTEMYSNVINSTIQASDIIAANVRNLADIDDASVQLICDKIAALPAAKLAQLATAILNQLQVSASPAPSVNEASYLPTEIAGSRDFLLGKPDGWVQAPDGNAIPSYRI